MQQHYSRPFDTLTLVLTPYYSSESTKQLSTFHLPFGGDENVLAKVQVLQSIFVFVRRSYDLYASA